MKYEVGQIWFRSTGALLGRRIVHIYGDDITWMGINDDFRSVCSHSTFYGWTLRQESVLATPELIEAWRAEAVRKRDEAAATAAAKGWPRGNEDLWQKEIDCLDAAARLLLLRQTEAK